MADTVVATYGASPDTTVSFHYCGFRAASGTGADPPPDHDIIRVWLNRYDSLTADYADVTVTVHSDAGSPPAQFVWVATPGGTHVTTYGDEDGGSGTLSMPNEFYDSDYYEIRIASRADLHYCFDVLVNSEPIPPSGATHFEVVAPPSVGVGEEFEFTVTAKDDDEATVTDYSGTVHFTTTDDAGELPGDSTLTAGTGTFPATLHTVGTQTIVATDTVDSDITGSDDVDVTGIHDGWWGLAHSGRDTFWASRTDASALADEFTWDGDIVQTIEIAYPALHAWLGPEV